MTNDRDTTKTYIIVTDREEFYCGVTIDLKRRMEQHKKAESGSWFKFNDRGNFKLILTIIGDYESEIKSFGVRKFYEMFKNKKVSLS